MSDFGPAWTSEPTATSGTYVPPEKAFRHGEVDCGHWNCVVCTPLRDTAEIDD